VTEQQRIDAVHGMLARAKALAAVEDPVLDEVMPRVVAILHDAVRLIDPDYMDDSLSRA
jgi:hypothetical protein